MRLAGRRASVELRKFLLDGSPLVHRVLRRPRFHPLRSKERLVGDVYRNAKTLQIAPSTEDGRRGPVASQTWAITVHPLYGLRYEEAGNEWHLEPLFDVDVQPMTLDTWSRQRLFRVSGREYSLMTTLKFVSNREGAHVDIMKDAEVKDMERVHFGHVTYPHLVAMLVASYVLHQYRTGFREDEDRWSRFGGTHGHSPGEYKVLGGADFSGETFPVGLEGEMHETRIPVPMSPNARPALDARQVTRRGDSGAVSRRLRTCTRPLGLILDWLFPPLHPSFRKRTPADHGSLPQTRYPTGRCAHEPAWSARTIRDTRRGLEAPPPPCPTGMLHLTVVRFGHEQRQEVDHWDHYPSDPGRRRVAVGADHGCQRPNRRPEQPLGAT